MIIRGEAHNFRLNAMNSIERKPSIDLLFWTVFLSACLWGHLRKAFRLDWLRF